MAPNSKKRTIEASSDSDIAEVIPESDAANSQPQDSKKISWVWQYFKTETVGDKSYNICQASRVPGGSVLCLKKLAVDKKSSTKSMSNHLNSCHGIQSNAQSNNIGAITAFMKTGKASKKLTRDSLTSAVARFFISSNIPYQVVDHDDFTKLLRLCNPITKSLLCGKDTLASFIRTAFQQGQHALWKQFETFDSKLSLTCDVWTSPNNVSVLGVTAHWISKDYALKSMVLAAKLVEGNHSGVKLANHLAKVLEHFSLKNSIFCITANNASNGNTMDSHLATLIPSDNNNCQLGCMAHVINIAAQNSI